MFCDQDLFFYFPRMSWTGNDQQLARYYCLQKENNKKIKGVKTNFYKAKQLIDERQCFLLSRENEEVGKLVKKIRNNECVYHILSRCWRYTHSKHTFIL